LTQEAVIRTSGKKDHIARSSSIYYSNGNHERLVPYCGRSDLKKTGSKEYSNIKYILENEDNICINCLVAAGLMKQRKKA